jgi:hypothetical protein
MFLGGNVKVPCLRPWRMRRYSEVSIGPSCGLALKDRADSKITRATRVEKQGSLMVKLSRVTNLKNQNLRAVSNVTTVSEVLAIL